MHYWRFWHPPPIAHGVASGDAGYIQESSGVLLVPFAYLGAKHMVTGYDPLLFLLGVIFFLYRLKDIGVAPVPTIAMGCADQTKQDSRGGAEQRMSRGGPAFSAAHPFPLRASA